MASTKTKRTRSRRFRLIRGAIIAFVSIWTLYVVGMNVFLSSSLFERVIDGDPETIDIHFRRGWSVIPGRIHAQGLSIRGTDSNVEWILKLDKADFDVSFVALASKRFDVSRVHGRGISFRVRNRLDAAPATPEEIAHAAGLPPIDGLPPWSVRPPKEDSPEVWSDAHYHLWTAHLENIVADDIHEIWIDRAHFQGDARIDGRFYFKPIRKVDVGPTHVTIRRGRIHFGSTLIADDLGGTVDATTPPFDPRTIETPKLIRSISATTELHARVPEIASVVDALLPRGTRIAGPMEVRVLALDVRSGVLHDGTHVELGLPDASIETGDHRVTGAIAVTARVENARLDATAECTRLAIARARESIADASRAIVTADARSLDLAAAEPLDDLHLVVDLRDAHLPSARVLNRYIPKATPIAIVAGHADGRARFELWRAEKRASGEGSLRGHDLALRVAKLRVRGQTTAAMSFAAFRFDTGHAEDVKLALSVTKGALAYERAPKRPLVDVAGLRLDAHAADLVLDDPLRDLDARVVISEASIVEPGLLAEYLPKGSAMHIRGDHGRFALEADLAIVDHLAKGSLDIHSKDLGLTFNDLTLTAGVRARAKVHDWRWERGDLALDRAAVDVTNVVVVTRGGNAGDRLGLTVRRILVTARSQRFDLTDPLALVTFTANVEGARVRDPAVLNAFLPEGAAIRVDAEEGLLAAIATATVRRHIARATLAASAKDMGFTDGKIHLLGDATLEAVVSDWDLAKSTLAVNGARAVLANVKGRLRPEGDPEEISARRIELLATTPFLDFAKPTRENLDLHLVVEDAVMPDARALRAFIPEGGLFSVESGAARLSADIELASSKSRAKGAVEIDLLHAGVALDRTHFAGDFHVTAKVSQFESDAAKLDLSGTLVRMRNVSVSGVSTPTTGWSGDLVFDQASLELTPRTLIEGGFHLEARDANPLFGLVFKNEMPGTLHFLTSMDHLSASGRITADAEGVSLDELDARGGSTRAHGSYASEHGERRGAFVVEWGSFGVGLRITSGVTVQFFGLQRWLDDERKLVDGVRKKGTGASSRKAKTR